ncbi:MAG: hypothetical protein ACKV2T_05280 [Kofleriaceae bacterium]
MDRIEGPFATANAYCSFRESQLGKGASDIGTRTVCVDIELEGDVAPRVKTGQAIRGYRFVTLEHGTHLVVETATGWYGRELESASNGDSAYVAAVRLADVIGDRDDELVIDTAHSHEPCGCDADLWHTMTTTVACTVRDGALLCTDGTTTADDMHLADIWSWSSTLSITRDGYARRVITASENVSARKLRALAKPSRLRFRR